MRRVLSVLAGVALLLVAAVAAQATAAEITIPRAAAPYKSLLIRVAHAELGLDAPVALLAAQVHTESRWNTEAVSRAGAQGLAQFMPATAAWLPEVAPQTGAPAPFNPGWSLRAMCAYDKWLASRINGAASACDRWAFVLCAYNGGLGWVNRDRALAPAKGYDASRYWDNVEHVNAGRSAANFRENRNYPVRIFEAQHAYAADGWGAVVVCGP